MTATRTLGLAVFLTASVASAGFAATGNEAGHTTTPTSPTMSAPNVPSHDGSSQLGYENGAGTASRYADNPGAASLHRGDHAGNMPAGASQEPSDPNTGPGCGGGC